MKRRARVNLDLRDVWVKVGTQRILAWSRRRLPEDSLEWESATFLGFAPVGMWGWLD